MTEHGRTNAAIRDRMRTRSKGLPIPIGVAAATASRLGRATLFDFAPAIGDLGEWTTGGYPSNFMPYAYASLGVTDATRVLHLCAGGVQVGVTVDIRAELHPTVVADCRALPFADESFDWIMADPPYAESYAETLYGTGSTYPRPAQILREAARVLRPGGRFGLLHYIAPRPRHAWRVVLREVRGVWVGTDMAIRSWAVYEKVGPTFAWGPSPLSHRQAARARNVDVDELEDAERRR